MQTNVLAQLAIQESDEYRQYVTYLDAILKSDDETIDVNTFNGLRLLLNKSAEDVKDDVHLYSHYLRYCEGRKQYASVIAKREAAHKALQSVRKQAAAKIVGLDPWADRKLIKDRQTEWGEKARAARERCEEADKEHERLGNLYVDSDVLWKRLRIKYDGV